MLPPLLTLALSLALPLVSGVTLLRRELADPRARCNDGTQAVYYHDQVRPFYQSTSRDRRAHCCVAAVWVKDSFHI